MATGSSPRRAGSKRQRRTASAAASSRSPCPAVRSTATSVTRPSVDTKTRSKVVPWIPRRRAVAGYRGWTWYPPRGMAVRVMPWPELPLDDATPVPLPPPGPPPAPPSAEGRSRASIETPDGTLPGDFVLLGAPPPALDARAGSGVGPPAEGRGGSGVGMRGSAAGGSTLPMSGGGGPGDVCTFVPGGSTGTGGLSSTWAGGSTVDILASTRRGGTSGFLVSGTCGLGRGGVTSGLERGDSVSSTTRSAWITASIRGSRRAPTTSAATSSARWIAPDTTNGTAPESLLMSERRNDTSCSELNYRRSELGRGNALREPPLRARRACSVFEERSGPSERWGVGGHLKAPHSSKPEGRGRRPVETAGWP
jgi:hypothetical protein